MAAPQKTTNITGMDAKAVSSTVMVTPEVAANWLECNVSNRRIRQSRVEQYSRDMANGDWRLTGETIKFSTSRELLDGQHRLWAVVESGVTVPMVVVRGLKKDAQLFIDAGAARTVADNFGLQGETNSMLLAAMARIGFLIDSGLYNRDKSNRTISHAEMYTWLADNPGARDSVSFVSGPGMKAIKMPPSVKAYCHYRFSQFDPDGADEFFRKLSSLAGLPQGSPILALAHRLFKAASDNQRINSHRYVHATFRVWNAWRRGAPMTRVLLILDGGTRELPPLH